MNKCFYCRCKVIHMEHQHEESINGGTMTTYKNTVVQSYHCYKDEHNKCTKTVGYKDCECPCHVLLPIKSKEQ